MLFTARHARGPLGLPDARTSPWLRRRYGVAGALQDEAVGSGYLDLPSGVQRRCALSVADVDVLPRCVQVLALLQIVKVAEPVAAA